MKSKKIKNSVKPRAKTDNSKLKANRGVKKKKETIKNETLNSKFLKNLLLKKQEAESIINSLLNNQKEDLTNTSFGNYIEEFDRADREISAQTFYKLLDRKKKELEKINLLINRIQNDQDFGLCEECGMRIPVERLLIMPDASLCVPCQKDLEKFENRKNLAKSPYIPAQLKKEFQLENNEDYDDEDDDGIVIKPDVDQVSFLDMEEIEMDNNQDDDN